MESVYTYAWRVQVCIQCECLYEMCAYVCNTHVLCAYACFVIACVQRARMFYVCMYVCSVCISLMCANVM